LVAYHLNQNKHPIYGCYVVKQNWFFMIFDGMNYAVSNAYNASDDDLYKITAILIQVKDYIKSLQMKKVNNQ
jgi:hypothetical protein